MKLNQIIIHKKFFVYVLLGTAVGYLVGLGISYINVFGSSSHAPFMCALVCGCIAIARNIKTQNRPQPAANT